MTDPTEFDGDQKELFKELLLSSENDGSAYVLDIPAEHRATVAADQAYHFEKNERIARLQHDYSVIKPALVSVLARKWSKT